MHELGTVVYIIDTLETLAKEENLTDVASVTLEIGEVSSIVPDYLVDCWNYSHVKSKLLKDSKLKINIIPAVTLCEECEKIFSTVQYKKQCPYCKSYFTHLIRGNEFNIKEIEAC